MGNRGTTTRRATTRALAALAVALVLAGTATACSSDGSDGATGSDGSAATTTTVAAAGDSGDDAGTTTEPADRGSTADPADGGRISVLSYNVAGLPVEISKEHPDVNLPLISPRLNDYDVVITQEDFDWWPEGGLASTVDFVNYHDRLRADATHEYRSERHPGPEATDLTPERIDQLELGDGLGVLSRFPISGNTRVPWTGCFGGFDTSDGGAADCLAMKGFSVTQLELADGIVVDLYDLHGEAGGSATDQELQAADFEQLAAYIAEHSEGHAIILGGDTNLHTDPPGPDAHEDSGDGADLEIWETFLSATGLSDSCPVTGCDGPGRIDKIAYRSGPDVELAALSHEFHGDTFVDAAGEPLGDHEPLEVVIAWAPTA